MRNISLFPVESYPLQTSNIGKKECQENVRRVLNVQCEMPQIKIQHWYFATFPKQNLKRQTTWKERPQNLSHKDPRLSASVFPRCHLRLAINLCWTCQLSSLITYRPTRFPANSPPSATERDPFACASSPPPSLLSESENIWGSQKSLWSCVDGLLLCRKECPGLCRLPHGWADTVWHGWVWWDVARQQRRLVGLWTITGMWEQRGEGLVSQLSPTHGGLTGDGGLSDHVPWFRCP